jgi:hypothetical protein
MDSLDKGAGWLATDGPISNMSAKGVTGNMMPNQNEVGGRSGEGRSGKSHGQMVEETAQGKGGRQTPTRLTPSPFEQGSVEDSAKGQTGGSTGGGKLSGFSEEGLRGPVPPEMAQKMARLKNSQSKIRQQAEALSLRLRKYNLPSGEIETSLLNMKRVEEAVGNGDAQKLRQSYNSAVNLLKDAKSSVMKAQGIRREKITLPENVQREIYSGVKEGVPLGYEELSGKYFKAIAERK